MRLLCHRGHWKSDGDKDSLEVLTKAFSLGYGVETDVRDFAGKLVISHDPPTSGAVTFDAFLEASKIAPKAMLALNIKSDGLQAAIDSALKAYEIENYFVFDMSVPDTLGYPRIRAFINRCENA